MCFGGTFEPAYVMTVSALPFEMQPTTNKRNAALIQKHMEEALGVPSIRGFLRFIPAPEENIARGGKTLAGEIDGLGKDFSRRNDENLDAAYGRSRPGKRLSVKVCWKPSWTESDRTLCSKC